MTQQRGKTIRACLVKHACSDPFFLPGSSTLCTVSLRHMRILILGGTTLTGPYAVRRLHSLGHEVTVLHRGEHETELPSGVRHLHDDFAKLPREAFDPAPDAVVHMWAMTEMDAESFLRTFRGVASRAVVISSGDVYRAYGRLTGVESGAPDPIPLSEDAPLRESRYPYRRIAPNPDHWMAQYDKVLVEQVLMHQTDLATCILRFPAVVGPKEHRRFQQWLQPMLRGDVELRIQEGWARWRWTHGFAEDVAEAVVLAVTNSASARRIYNVGSPTRPRWRNGWWSLRALLVGRDTFARFLPPSYARPIGCSMTSRIIWLMTQPVSEQNWAIRKSFRTNSLWRAL